MGINETAVVSCYVDAAALLVMVLLLLLSERIRQRKAVPLRVFFLLCCAVTATCVFCFMYNAMYKQTSAWSHSFALGARTMRCYMVLLIVVLWLFFVNAKLYGARQWNPVVQRILFLPIAAYAIMLMVNFFTGIVFTISPENLFEPKPLYYFMFVIEYIYFALSALGVWLFDRKATKVRFFHIGPMIICVALSCIPMLVSRYDTSDLGFAVGLTLLYFSMIPELRYTDEESGLYQRGFLAYLVDLALIGKNDARSALILEADGNLPAAFDILRDTLHQDGDVIRLEEKKFLMFSPSDSRSALQLLSTHVEEAVVKHNTDHPEETVQITMHSRIRPAAEDPLTFLRSALEDKDAGDPMRGVVSMISELDRLDEELKLAADIQLNMLPMNFPPFPDRNEFDLYAIMDPAKEVGGDFYDFFLIDSDHLGLVIADVSGKGIPAALFMMVSKTLIKNQLLSGADPATALERVNLQLCERNSSMMFVTVWLSVVEISTGKGTACNAGHENPGLRRAGNGFELLKYKHGMVVGVNKNAKYQNREYELHPGDCVFVYTDGVPESASTTNELFGGQRLLDTLNRDADAGPEELVRRVLDAAEQFAQGAPQFDDITMLCMKYRGVQDQQDRRQI